MRDAHFQSGLCNNVYNSMAFSARDHRIVSRLNYHCKKVFFNCYIQKNIYGYVQLPDMASPILELKIIFFAIL